MRIRVIFLGFKACNFSLLLIGMLAAKGTSILRNVYTINRGYEDLAERLNSLGAQITVMSDL